MARTRTLVCAVSSAIVRDASVAVRIAAKPVSKVEQDFVVGGEGVVCD